MNAPERIDMPDDGPARAARFRERLQETLLRLRSGHFFEAVHCFLVLEDPREFEAVLAVRTAEQEHDRLHDNVYPLTRKWLVLLKTWKAWTVNPTNDAAVKLKAAFTAWESHPGRTTTERDVIYVSLAGKVSRLLVVVESAPDIRRTVSSLD